MQHHALADCCCDTPYGLVVCIAYTAASVQHHDGKVPGASETVLT